MAAPGTVLSFALAAAPPAQPAGASLQPASDAVRTAGAAIGRAWWRPGHGLTLRSAGGRFSLQLSLHAQVQAVVRHRGPIPATGTMSGEPPSLFRPGQPAFQDFHLSLRRARLILAGNAFAPHIKYRFELTGAPVELGYRGSAERRLPLLDVFLRFDRLRDLTVQIGQFKVPYNHQRMLRASGLQFVDRAGVNDEFTLDRDVGIDLRSTDVAGLGKLRYYAGVYIGDGPVPQPRDFGLAYVGRIELTPFGTYDDLEESDHDRTGPRLLIGGAFAYIQLDPRDTHGPAGAEPADGRRPSTANATTDMNFRWAGFSFEGGFFWRKAVAQTRYPYGGSDDLVEARNGTGYFTQAGYLLPRAPLELGARWGRIHPAGDPSATIRSLRDRSELGGVFNYYFARHALKLQVDYLRVWQTDIRTGFDYFRLQLQVVF